MLPTTTRGLRSLSSLLNMPEAVAAVEKCLVRSKEILCWVIENTLCVCGQCAGLR
jgi:hypothetical protein